MPSLKDTIKPQLALILLANVGAFYLCATAQLLADTGWTTILTNWKQLIPPSLTVLFVGIASAQATPLAKARVVFGRWKHPLPGSRAYTKYAAADPRIDMAALEQSFGPLPKDEGAQNSHWYKWFKSVDVDPAVAQAHREYLFARDYAFLALTICIISIPVAFWMFEESNYAWIWTAIAVVQFLVVRRAASHHGIRLVQTVCALKATGR